jgi:hypothetical protein
VCIASSQALAWSKLAKQKSRSQPTTNLPARFTERDDYFQLNLTPTTNSKKLQAILGISILQLKLFAWTEKALDQ